MGNPWQPAQGPRISVNKSPVNESFTMTESITWMNPSGETAGTCYFFFFPLRLKCVFTNTVLHGTLSEQRHFWFMASSDRTFVAGRMWESYESTSADEKWTKPPPSSFRSPSPKVAASVAVLPESHLTNLHNLQVFFLV